MSGAYKSVGPNGAVTYSDVPSSNSTVVKPPPPPPSATGTPNHTTGSVYTMVLVNGKERRMSYRDAEEYRFGLQEQRIQAIERAKRDLVEARNAAANFQNANVARDAFFAAGDKLANAQRELWEAAQEANATLGFQDRLQDGFSAVFSGIGVALLVVGTMGTAAPALVVGAGVANTALDWTNSALRQHNPNENDALDRWAKANDVAGLIPGARAAAAVGSTAAGVLADGVEISTSTPAGRQAIRNGVDWQRDAKGKLVKGPYQDRWGVDQKKIIAAVEKAEHAQAEFDQVRAAYEVAERRRFSRTSWSKSK
jgi:hypothetical protein